jgi:hypothetical protein
VALAVVAIMAAVVAQVVIVRLSAVKAQGVALPLNQP